MGTKKKTNRYEPLKIYFGRIEGSMDLAKFAEIEAVLYLLFINAPEADPNKAYLLFSNYQLIGATACTEKDHTLQQAKRKLVKYRSQKHWQDSLKEYQETKYEAFRAFSFEKTEKGNIFFKAEESYPYPYENRKEEWNEFWPEEFEDPKSVSYAEEGKYYYYRRNSENSENECVYVEFDKLDKETMQVESNDYESKLEKGCRRQISVSLDELLKAAKEMAEIYPNDYCYEILKTNVLKQVNGSSVSTSTELKIQGVVNIVGMVGSGKSTLIKVLAFWCHKNGYRMTIVVDTVAEVMNLQKYLSKFGVSASPLIGRSERLKYINQVAQPNETYLEPIFSGYLTPSCLVDGMDDRHAESIVFGKEPCFSFYKQKENSFQKKKYLCPYFNRCPGTKMLRDCYSASVVITTVAGFAVSKVRAKRELFLEPVKHDFDIVVFDESDRVQKTLDELFMPETSFNDYIREIAIEAHEYLDQSSKSRSQDTAKQHYGDMQLKSTAVFHSVKASLFQNLSWNKIANGDCFSALLLLEDLYSDDSKEDSSKNSKLKIPKAVYEAIYNLIDIKEKNMSQNGTLWVALECSCIDPKNTSVFDKIYNDWINELGDKFPRPEDINLRQEQDNRIKLILRLIYFDHYIRDLRDAFESSHEISYGQNELFGFLQTRFIKQQYLLPSALCGNLFGMKKTDNDDIILYRQYAFGRSLMKDLPYLKTDSQGNPMGPHVIMLSGSSWAEESYEYHINRPVNYILEADRDKRAFLEKTRFFESGFTECVSGSPDDKRMEQLRLVTQNAVEKIIKEYERNAGKILLVVNSYAQAEQVQRTLQNELRSKNCPAKICRMVSDTVSYENAQGTVRRGEVNRFANMEEEILIAPALAIERGHNIVDETGHSALCAVFFMVRPMSVPDDIQQNGSKLNGLVESHCRRGSDESLFSYNLRARQYATQQWVKMNKTKSHGLSYLDDDEKKDIVATLFILILQIFGRLARVTDVTKPEPHVYFIDGAFRGVDGKKESFDCLSELGRYLDTLMTGEDSAEIAETLYDPFYKAYRKDIPYEKEPNNLSAGI